MSNLNEHIKPNQIDIYTAKDYGIAQYDEMVKFSRWLETQAVRFDNAEQALKVYQDKEEAPTAQTNNLPHYTEKTFKSRQQLNSFLRRNGYRWSKIAPMNESEEDYNESYQWQLYAADDRAVTVEEALKEIG